jgi:hypothetical protein
VTALEHVQAIYAAFGRGDVPAILEHLSPDIDWEYGARPNPIPWLQPRHGREGAAQFFADLSRSMRIERFAPKHLLADGDLVAVVLDIEFVVVATGKRVVEEDEVHLWRFGADGLVNRFRHRLDTALQAAACE